MHIVRPLRWQDSKCKRVCTQSVQASVSMPTIFLHPSLQRNHFKSPSTSRFEYSQIFSVIVYICLPCLLYHVHHLQLRVHPGPTALSKHSRLLTIWFFHCDQLVSKITSISLAKIYQNIKKRCQNASERVRLLCKKSFA